MAAPKPNIPIVDYPTPSIILDTVLVERTSNLPGNYSPQEPGAPYPKQGHSAAQSTALEGHEFLGQKATQDQEWMLKYWAKPPSTQDIANWEAGYFSEANAYPIFQRRYLEKRDSYTPRTKLTPLPGLYRINVTSAGSGYTVPPTISFTGGTGSGASAIAVLDNNGGIAKITLKAEGTYTVAPSVVITAIGGGSGAVATASVQLAACVLIKEDVTDNAPDNYRALYVVVTRIYMTLPGPILPGRAMADQAQGAVVNTTKQMLAVTESDLIPDWKTLSYSDTTIDANRKERNVVTMPDSVFPTLTDYDQDPEMQSLITTTFQIVQASAVSAPSAVAGVITRYKHIDKWRSLKIVETYATPAPYSEQKFSGQNFPNLFTSFSHDEDCGTCILQRGSFSAMVEIRLDISFGSFSAVTGLTLIPNTFAFGSFRVSDILNDAATLTSSGACGYSLALPASSPSKSTYQAYGSTKQKVSGECVLWKAGLFRKTELFVLML